MLKISRVLALAGFVTAAGGCATAAYADDFFAPYFQRKDTVTLSAGNAKASNAATQIIDPWPRYVGNRHIPSNAQRMINAYHRYRDVGCLARAPQPMNHPGGLGLGLGGGGGTAAALAAGGGERAGCDDGPGTSGPAGSFNNSNSNSNANVRGAYDYRGVTPSPGSAAP
jgi:hypothetical protein